MTNLTGAHAAVTKASFGTMQDGREVDLYTLKSDLMEARVTTYGARVVSIQAPDRNGKMGEVVLGYDELKAYLEDDKTHFGGFCGRYANRIANGSFKIDGQEYHLPINNNGQTLHGGIVGFDSLLWQAHAVAGGVEMTLVSPDGDQGFPGTLTVHVRFSLHHALRMDYSVSTDKATVANLTNHSYFNLAGEGTILNHEVTLAADQYLPVTKVQIPTGELATVEGTPFDFRKPHRVGARSEEDNEQLKIAGGYDHTWVLRGSNGEVKTAGRLYDPNSGRVLTVTTTEPAVHFYTGNSLMGTKYGSAQKGYPKHSGLCLETQHFPDSPNQPAFPTTLLKPGETRHSMTTFTFSTQAK